jgi:hypothetical protein
MGRDHPGDLEKNRWMITNLVFRNRPTMCNVICRSVVSSGGLFEHGDELPDFTKTGKIFRQLINCGLFTGDPCQGMDNPRIMDSWQEQAVFLFSERFRSAL